jgi:hypothetical protein
LLRETLKVTHKKTDKIYCLPKGIITLSKKIGVKVDNQNLDSVNLLKEMEIARHNVNEKEMI